MTSTMRGSRGRIGFLLPADGLTDDEYWSCLPDGVALLAARYLVAGGLGRCQDAQAYLDGGFLRRCMALRVNHAFQRLAWVGRLRARFYLALGSSRHV